MRERWTMYSKFTNALLRRHGARVLLLILAVVAIATWHDSTRVLRAAAPPATTLVSPDSVTVRIGKPYFVWDEEATATEYRLRVDDGGGTVIDEWLDIGDVCSGSVCGVTAPGSLPNDDYTWWIQTKNLDGTGPLSSSMTFTVTAHGVVDGGYSDAVAADRDGFPSGWASISTAKWETEARSIATPPCPCSGSWTWSLCKRASFIRWRF